MYRIKSVFISGGVATFVAGSMLLMNNALHGIPEIHVARTLAAALGSPDNTMIGAVAIMFIGVVVLSGLYAVFAPRLPQKSYYAKSLVFAASTWLFMMLVYMPLAGAGAFGLGRGPIVPVATLILHLAYWLTLALSYQWLTGPQSGSTAKA